MDGKEQSCPLDESGIHSPVPESPFPQHGSQFLNAFWEVDCYTREMLSDDNLDGDLLDQPVANCSHGSAMYVDTEVQSSPDSGVDMSSPELKIGYLSSLEDLSPRIQDSFLRQDDGKPKPKYPDIGNIQMDQFNTVGMERRFDYCEASPSRFTAACSSVRDETNAISPTPMKNMQAEAKSVNQCCQSVHMNKNHGYPGEFRTISNTGLVSSEQDPFRDQVTDGSIANGDETSVPEVDISVGESPMKNTCTLAELNLSQTSASSDQLSTPSKRPTLADSCNDTGVSRDDVSSDAYLFPPLQDDFSDYGSPVKTVHLTSLISPQQRALSPFTSRHTTSLSPSNVSTPVESKCASYESPAKKGDEYLLEYQKFLQSCGAGEVQGNNEFQTRRSRRKLSRSRKRSHSFTEVFFPRCRQVKRRFLIQKPVITQKGNTGKILISSRPEAIPGNTASEKLRAGVTHHCPCRNLFSRPRRKQRNFNPMHFIRAEQKVTRLRRSAVKFLKAIFPHLDYPSPKRTLATVDVLLNQVLNCLLDRKPTCVSKQLQVIPVSDHIKDVRVVICQSPVSCIRHLRHKICQVIKAVLPHLDFRWLSDQNTDQVDTLLKYITRQNSVKK